MIYQLIGVCIILKIIAQQNVAESSAISDQQQQFELNCYLNIQSLMNFLYNKQCVQIILNVDGGYSVKCIADMMKHSPYITTYTRSMSWMLKRNIYVEKTLSESVENVTTRFCENYLIFLENIQSIKTIITTMDPKNTTRNFYPFSKIYFIIEDLNYTAYDMKSISEMFYNRSLFGYIFEFDVLTNKFNGIRDLLTLNYTVVNYYRKTNLIHPFVDRNNKRKTFRISFHEYFPYIKYIDEAKLRFTGTEYRLVEEVVRNWKIEYLFRDRLKTSVSPYVSISQDLRDHSTDIGIGAFWLTGHNYNFDSTTYHCHVCISMLVPKPTKLSQATLIYTTLSYPVWILFSFSFLSTAILLWGIAKTKIIRKNRYISLIRTFLDITAVVTSHGVNHFTQQKSTNVLLFSWILLSFWIGISYSTIYTSRLTSPGFSTLIDTLAEFFNNGLYWGSYFRSPAITIALELSSNPEYQQLLKGGKMFIDRNDAMVSLNSGKCCILGLLAKKKYLFNIEWSKELHLFIQYRLMRKMCILDYYLTFQLQKFSPYTELFNEYALRFQEHGFSEYWYRVMFREKRWYETFFEDYPQPDKEHIPLTVASISGALTILILNFIIATIVFVFEILLKSIRF